MIPSDSPEIILLSRNSPGVAPPLPNPSEAIPNLAIDALKRIDSKSSNFFITGSTVHAKAERHEAEAARRFFCAQAMLGEDFSTPENVKPKCTDAPNGNASNQLHKLRMLQQLQKKTLREAWRAVEKGLEERRKPEIEEAWNAVYGEDMSERAKKRSAFASRGRGVETETSMDDFLLASRYWKQRYIREIFPGKSLADLQKMRKEVEETLQLSTHLQNMNRSEAYTTAKPQPSPADKFLSKTLRSKISTMVEQRRLFPFLEYCLLHQEEEDLKTALEVGVRAYQQDLLLDPFQRPAVLFKNLKAAAFWRAEGTQGSCGGEGNRSSGSGSSVSSSSGSSSSTNSSSSSSVCHCPEDEPLFGCPWVDSVEGEFYPIINDEYDEVMKNSTKSVQGTRHMNSSKAATGGNNTMFADVGGSHRSSGHGDARVLGGGNWKEIVLFDRLDQCHEGSDSSHTLKQKQNTQDQIDSSFKNTKQWLRENVPSAVRMAEQGFGEIIISRLSPKTHIKAHCAPNNTRLTLHLGLDVPKLEKAGGYGEGSSFQEFETWKSEMARRKKEVMRKNRLSEEESEWFKQAGKALGNKNRAEILDEWEKVDPQFVVPRKNLCVIRVGEEWRQWQQGKILLFDDSLEHEVRNDTDQFRTVFLMRFWHPGVYENVPRFLKEEVDIKCSGEGEEASKNSSEDSESFRKSLEEFYICEDDLRYNWANFQRCVPPLPKVLHNVTMFEASMGGDVDGLDVLNSTDFAFEKHLGLDLVGRIFEEKNSRQKEAKKPSKKPPTRCYWCAKPTETERDYVQSHPQLVINPKNSKIYLYYGGCCGRMCDGELAVERKIYSNTGGKKETEEGTRKGGA
jgi:hypothetical protein